MNKNLKKIIFIMLIVVSINVLTGCTSLNGNLFEIGKDTKSDEMRILNYDEVKDSLIRFHVIANSDTEEDQNLKLKIKNKVIDYLYPYLNSSESLEESREIIKNKMNDVKKLAEEEIRDDGYGYGVSVQLSRENFPDKSYGNITLPQGNYEAFRVIIGSGQGKNWWCVMFPPLCFVDESKAQVEYDKTERRIKSSQKKQTLKEEIKPSEDNKLEKGIKSEDNESEKEIKSENDNSENEVRVENNKSDDDEKDKAKEIHIKFKVVEILKELFK